MAIYDAAKRVTDSRNWHQCWATGQDSPVMNLGLKGKHALVTGGSHGIGRSISLALAEEGCNIAICSRTKERTDATLAEIESRGVECLGIQADVLSASDITDCCNSIIREWGSIQILVNNVGGGGRWGSPIVEETGDDVWREVYDKNAMAAVRFTRFFIPHMRQQKWGRVVTIASVYGREGGGRPWFNMAKSAEISLMKTLSMDPYLARDGITFNTIAPGGIMIPGTGWEEEQRDDPEGFRRVLEQQLPLRRMGTPEEVASVVAFVCSEQSSLVNGSTIAVDGGESHAF